MNTHSSLPPPSPTPFLKGENKTSKKLGRKSNFKQICRRNHKGKGKENAKVIGRWDVFIFIFSYDGN